MPEARWPATRFLCGKQAGISDKVTKVIDILLSVLILQDVNIIEGIEVDQIKRGSTKSDQVEEVLERD